MKTRILLCCISALAIFSSCNVLNNVPESKYGDKATTMVSQNYKYNKEQKIVVLPFVVNGKPDEITSPSTADKFSVKVMELGLFSLISPGILEDFSSNGGLKMPGSLSQKQLDQIHDELGIDLIFYGTLNYNYVPKKSYSATDSYGNYSSSSLGEQYLLENESLKVVDTQTGEVVITSYTSSSNCGSLSQEMAYSIWKKLAPQPIAAIR